MDSLDVNNTTVKQINIRPNVLCSVDGCNAYRIKGSSTCFSHSPTNKLPKGKQKNRTDLVLSNDLISLKKYLIELVLKLQRGRLKPQVANSINNLVNTMIKCTELVEIQDKIEKLTRLYEAHANKVSIDDLDCLEAEYNEENKQ